MLIWVVMEQFFCKNKPSHGQKCTSISVCQPQSPLIFPRTGMIKHLEQNKHWEKFIFISYASLQSSSP